MKNRIYGIATGIATIAVSTPCFAANWYDVSLDTTPVTAVMTGVMAGGAIIWACRKGYNALFKS